MSICVARCCIIARDRGPAYLSSSGSQSGRLNELVLRKLSWRVKQGVKGLCSLAQGTVGGAAGDLLPASDRFVQLSDVAAGPGSAVPCQASVGLLDRPVGSLLLARRAPVSAHRCPLHPPPLSELLLFLSTLEGVGYMELRYVESGCDR